MSEPDPRYPIGKFRAPESISADDRAGWIERIASAPARLRQAVSGLPEARLDTPYREGGWTIRQVVHHVPDSHMNAYVRFKLALTENEPVVKPYDEAVLARLRDSFETPVEASLAMLDALHRRWVVLMRSLSEEEWRRRFIHPEYSRPQELETVVAMYAWHGDHHIAHVRQAPGLSVPKD